MNVRSLLPKEWVCIRSDNFFLNGQQDVRLSYERILLTAKGSMGIVQDFSEVGSF